MCDPAALLHPQGLEHRPQQPRHDRLELCPITASCHLRLLLLLPSNPSTTRPTASVHLCFNVLCMVAYHPQQQQTAALLTIWCHADAEACQPARAWWPTTHSSSSITALLLIHLCLEPRSTLRCCSAAAAAAAAGVAATASPFSGTSRPPHAPPHAPSSTPDATGPSALPERSSTPDAVTADTRAAALGALQPLSCSRWGRRPTAAMRRARTAWPCVRACVCVFAVLLLFCARVPACRTRHMHTNLE